MEERAKNLGQSLARKAAFSAKPIDDARYKSFVRRNADGTTCAQIDEDNTLFRPFDDVEHLNHLVLPKTVPKELKGRTALYDPENKFKWV